MAIFKVTVETEMVVEADNDTDAMDVALHNIRENDEWIAQRGDCILSLDELPGSWDKMCLPFGGDGETRLKDLLPEA